MITNEQADVANNPDGVAILWATLEKELVRLVGREGNYLEIEGSPDWAMEIVSDSSVKKDYVELFKKYHRAGIREYWLIDARGEDILFQICQWRKQGYRKIQPKNGWLASPVFGRSFRLTRALGRDDLWAYALLVK